MQKNALAYIIAVYVQRAQKLIPELLAIVIALVAKGVVELLAKDSHSIGTNDRELRMPFLVPHLYVRNQRGSARRPSNFIIPIKF